MSWQWRSDVAPLVQPVMPGTVAFDPRSEEGRMLLAWGFTPKVLGYFPNVRGVITGLLDQTDRVGESSIVGCRTPMLRLTPQESASHRGTPARPSGNDGRPQPGHDGSVRPRWTWDTTFLGSLTASLRKELVGVTPDGLRVNWHVIEGSFVGPGSCDVLPGAPTDSHPPMRC